jgi:hypothetical protein
MMKFRTQIAALALLLAQFQAASGQECSHGATTSVKGNSLFLYFPTASDSSFESSISGVTTSPLEPFDVADLDSGVGTTTQLRDRVIEIVTEDFCEFNVDVNDSTTAPSTTGIARWQIVGIGSDSKLLGTNNLFGISSLGANTNDADAQDYTRVWAASFDDAYGGAGGALNGTNSTLERWARAIGSTTSHEVAHNYGVTHCAAGPLTGEDGPTNHIMNTGNVAGQGCSYTDTVDGFDRAGNRRHFSDQGYEVLAHNIGLNIMTVYNWDFINPNAENAHELEITLLSSASSLSLSTWWNGSRSPWRDPTISSVCSNCETFQGTSYNKFVLDFSVDKSWTGGADGVVPGGAEFHIGAGFAESDLVIVWDTKLKDASGSDLTLHPRMAGFDRGAADLSSGDFAMAMFNTDSAAGDLTISDLSIQFLPRLLGIDSMVVGAEMWDVRGIPVKPHGSCDPRRCQPRRDFKLGTSRKFHLGNLTDDRFVDIIHDATDCDLGAVTVVGADMEGASLKYCMEGNSLSLFPSTSVYVTATIVDPEARYYDREAEAYVNGPLESKVFYQFVGMVPDFNDNGVDDLIDIREGTSVDRNENGVVDEAEPGQPPAGEKAPPPPTIPWWVYLVWVLLLLIIMILYSGRRKAAG